MDKYILNSTKETQELGQHLGGEILAGKPQKTAVVLALTGDLGAGKTTFLQGFAKGLGITEVVNSPTFIIMKKFEIKKSDFKFFYHFDLYRLESQKDLEFLHFEEVISDPKNIIAIEWPATAYGGVSPEAGRKFTSVTFKHLGGNKRELTISK